MSDGTTTVWAVRVGYQGRWHTTTEGYKVRDEAVERLGWLRSLAAPSVSYQLIRETTTVTTVVEDD